MRLRPYLQLLRVPNLFTVPGDPLCGFLLASGGRWSGRAIPAMAISLCAYCAGLVLNDLADYSEDLRERPNRPLPHGAVSRKNARWLVWILFAEALAVSVGTPGPVWAGTLLLIGAILLYDLAAKKSPIFGPLAMGLCRGLSVYVGVLAFSGSYLSHLPLIATGAIAFYITCVSLLARRETANPRIPPLIGSLIRGLLFIQAGFCVLAGNVAGWTGAVVLLALWPISRLVGSYFYGS